MGITTKEEAVTESRSGLLGLPGQAFLDALVSHAGVLVGTFLLTIFLTPLEYGVFILIVSLLGILVYLADIGLTAALIQKKEDIDEGELRSAFTIQVALSFGLVGLLLLLSPLLNHFYSFGIVSQHLVWALSFFVLTVALKSIPLTLLEREFKFNRVTNIRSVETFVFFLVAVYFAWNNAGIAGFVWAIVARSFTGLVLVYIARPWLPLPGFSLERIKNLLNFGFNYQAGAFLTALREDALVLVLGWILGPTALGFLGWAQHWTSVPVKMFTENIFQVAFPAFSRIQDNPKELSASFSRMFFSIHALILPTLVGLVLVAPSVIRLIPDYEKWEPALPALVFFAVASGFSAHATPIINLLNAIGKAGLVTRVIFVWTALSWVILPYLAYNYGVYEVAIGSATLAIIGVLLTIFAYRYIRFDLIGSLLKPIIATALTAGMIFLGSAFFSASIVEITGLVILAIFVYFIILVILQ